MAKSKFEEQLELALEPLVKQQEVKPVVDPYAEMDFFHHLRELVEAGHRPARPLHMGPSRMRY